MMKSFILASSKPWSKVNFNNFVKKTDLSFLYVSTPDELNITLKKNQNYKYLFFLHWNWKVPLEIVKKYECICFHMTDLPYGRGGSPLQNLILNKKKDTVLSAFKMNEEIDAGPVYLKKPLSLNGCAEEIYNRADELSFEMISEIILNEPYPKPQKNNATYFKRRSPSQSLIPPNLELSEIYDFIRMLDAPTYPKAFLNHGNIRLELNCAKFFDNLIEARVIIKKK